MRCWVLGTKASAGNVRLHGARPWHPQDPSDLFLAASVSPHGARPWHPQDPSDLFLAASVSLHGARPWHQFGGDGEMGDCGDARLTSDMKQKTLPRSGRPVRSEAQLRAPHLSRANAPRRDHPPGARTGNPVRIRTQVLSVADAALRFLFL